MGNLLNWPRLPKLKECASDRAAAKSILLGCGYGATEAGQRDSAKRRTERKNRMGTADTNPVERTVASTQSEMTEIVLPNDTNTLGNLLGGRLMHFIDLTAAMAAYRHARTYIVTAAMDHIDFIRPVHLGNLVTLRSSINRAFTSSMEVGVKVWAEIRGRG